MKKVLVIRFSSIGDIVLTTPVIRAIKKQLPCELHFLTRSRYASLTSNNPYVDKVLTFEHNLKEVFDELKREQYDHVVDLQKNLRSVSLRRKLGRPSSSFPKVNREKWLLVNFKIDRLPKVHIVDRYFRAVEPLGVKNDGKGLDFFVPGNEVVNPSSIDLSLSAGYVGMVIGSRHTTKMVPVSKSAEIIQKLDMPVVLLGGPEDRERGDEILQLTSGKKVFNTCGNLSINQSASLVQQARVMVTNDTGLMHIAAAFNKPVISIWGSTVTEFGMYPYMPGKEDRSFISEVRDLNCRPCSKLGYKECPKKHFKCMMEQDVELIAARAKELFDVRGSESKV